MSRQLAKYERAFAAIAFAELGEHDTAMQLAGVSSETRSKLTSFFRYLQNLFAATAFTDVGCHNMALEFLGGQQTRMNDVKPLDRFLQETGLTGVRFYYVLARIP